MNTVLLALILWTFAPPTLAKDPSCAARMAQLAGPGVQTDVDQILALLVQKRQNSLDVLWNSPPFKAFVEKSGRAWVTSPDEELKRRWLVDYLHSYLSGYRDEMKLSKLRDRAWRRALRIHGYRAESNKPARESIEELSKKNLARVQKNIKYVSSPDMAEAESIVDELELFLSHNSHMMHSAPRYPVVSPREIEMMGLPDFSMSSDVFNKFIGSTDHVYFFVNFRKKNTLGAARSEYGKYGVILDSDYARRNAWISPFIMYPHEIYNAVKEVRPEAAQALFKKRTQIRADGTVTWTSKYRRVTDKKEIMDAMAGVHKSDFTLPDFEFLLKNQLLLSLREMKSRDPQAFAAALTELRELGEFHKKGPGVMHPLLHKLVFHPLGIPGRYEGRIPVAVPDQQLVHFKK